ncbi:uncharacterized protein METZ01_LOCUS498214 [marine metagenome]|uniref:Uncharacterized protein n=1 Tax=marine metagenome TaxID=408172 RepID=A0A383DM67_9ZZZZ
MLKTLKNPYESENGPKIILDATLDFLKKKKSLKKGFFDLNLDQNSD